MNKLDGLLKRVSILPLAIGMALPALGWSAQKSPDATIKNLHTAIQAEANAAHKYELFSNQAENEGHPQVAKLFEAASKAESIHLKNHQEALTALGGTPVAIQMKSVKVGSTRQNLEEPIKGEAQEQSTFYPRLIRQAEKDHAYQAMRSFTAAQKTEAQHERLFRQALAQLGHNPAQSYYVSKSTGETFAVPKNHTVPPAQRSKYILIG